MKNNEYTGTDQKTGQTRSMRCIIATDNKKRRAGHDFYDRKQVTHHRRSSGYSQSINKDSKTAYHLWRIGGAFSRYSLQSEPRSLEQIPCQDQDQGTGTRQKIKPASGWPPTIKHLAAVRSPQKVLANERDDPRYSPATFMIHSPPIKIKAVHKAWQAVNRNGARLCTKFIPLYLFPYTVMPIFPRSGQGGNSDGYGKLNDSL